MGFPSMQATMYSSSRSNRLHLYTGPSRIVVSSPLLLLLFLGFTHAQSSSTNDTLNDSATNNYPQYTDQSYLVPGILFSILAIGSAVTNLLILIHKYTSPHSAALTSSQLKCPTPLFVQFLLLSLLLSICTVLHSISLIGVYFIIADICYYLIFISSICVYWLVINRKIHKIYLYLNTNHNHTTNSNPYDTNVTYVSNQAIHRNRTNSINVHNNNFVNSNNNNNNHNNNTPANDLSNNTNTDISRILCKFAPIGLGALFVALIVTTALAISLNSYTYQWYFLAFASVVVLSGIFILYIYLKQLITKLYTHTQAHASSQTYIQPITTSTPSYTHTHIPTQNSRTHTRNNNNNNNINNKFNNKHAATIANSHSPYTVTRNNNQIPTLITRVSDMQNSTVDAPIGTNTSANADQNNRAANNKRVSEYLHSLPLKVKYTIKLIFFSMLAVGCIALAVLILSAIVIYHQDDKPYFITTVSIQHFNSTLGVDCALCIVLLFFTRVLFLNHVDHVRSIASLNNNSSSDMNISSNDTTNPRINIYQVGPAASPVIELLSPLSTNLPVTNLKNSPHLQPVSQTHVDPNTLTYPTHTRLKSSVDLQSEAAHSSLHARVVSASTSVMPPSVSPTHATASAVTVAVSNTAAPVGLPSSANDEVDNPPVGLAERRGMTGIPQLVTHTSINTSPRMEHLPPSTATSNNLHITHTSTANLPLSPPTLRPYRSNSSSPRPPHFAPHSSNNIGANSTSSTLPPYSHPHSPLGRGPASPTTTTTTASNLVNPNGITLFNPNGTVNLAVLHNHAFMNANMVQQATNAGLPVASHINLYPIPSPISARRHSHTRESLSRKISRKSIERTAGFSSPHSRTAPKMGEPRLSNGAPPLHPHPQPQQPSPPALPLSQLQQTQVGPFLSPDSKGSVRRLREKRHNSNNVLSADGPFVFDRTMSNTSNTSSNPPSAPGTATAPDGPRATSAPSTPSAPASADAVSIAISLPSQTVEILTME